MSSNPSDAQVHVISRKSSMTVQVTEKSEHATPNDAASTCTKKSHDIHIGPAEEKLSESNGKEELEDDWETDPMNARNWPSRKKWITVAIVSFYTFIPPLASSMLAPGLPKVAEKYNIENETITALTLSIFLISFALGPLILAPLSEMYGRTWILHWGNLFSLAFNLGCAFSPNTTSLIIFRFLNGLSGAAPIAIGGGSVGDLFSERERAKAMSLYTLGPLIAPALGPVAGGFLAEEVGIKWVFIVIAAACGVASLFAIPLLRETYAPVLKKRKAKKMDPENGTRVTPSMPGGNTSKLYYLWLNLSRPAVLLTRSFICFILSLYMAFIYGIYYLMFATFAKLFKDNYDFDAGIGGLVYLGLGTGFMLATYFGASICDSMYLRMADKNGGKGKPEMRIPPLIFGSLFIPIGLFWYGWSAQAKAHWIMPIIGSGIFGFGTVFLSPSSTGF
ncbi:hypothetical protein V5O48_011256 [Marasmius crinis-equi]|uniref:Major facilitator superfamily (MFS) profile domain-containing protein n=1 Tax=Marasmius crinis-equi TaxID=585013 RepID=A0ABR3F639_9AGAR